MAPKKKKDQGLMEAASLILSPYLYLGPRSSVTNAFLSKHGITAVLSIGATPACTSVPGVTYHRLSLADNPSAQLDAITDAANTLIVEACGLRSDRPYTSKKILVHCSAAISRSPAVVVAYLVKMCGLNLRNALGMVVKARPAVRPNAGFFCQLKEIEVKVRGAGSLDEVEKFPARREDRLALFLDTTS